MTHAVTIYSLDHLGLVAGTIDDLGLVSLIDSLIPQDLEQCQVSVGVCQGDDSERFGIC